LRIPLLDLVARWKLVAPLRAGGPAARRGARDWHGGVTRRAALRGARPRLPRGTSVGAGRAGGAGIPRAACARGAHRSADGVGGARSRSLAGGVGRPARPRAGSGDARFLARALRRGLVAQPARLDRAAGAVVARWTADGARAVARDFRPTVVGRAVVGSRARLRVRPQASEISVAPRRVARRASAIPTAG